MGEREWCCAATERSRIFCNSSHVGAYGVFPWNGLKAKFRKWWNKMHIHLTIPIFQTFPSLCRVVVFCETSVLLSASFFRNRLRTNTFVWGTSYWVKRMFQKRQPKQSNHYTGILQRLWTHIASSMYTIPRDLLTLGQVGFGIITAVALVWR